MKALIAVVATGLTATTLAQHGARPDKAFPDLPKYRYAYKTLYLLTRKHYLSDFPAPSTEWPHLLRRGEVAKFGLEAAASLSEKLLVFQTDALRLAAGISADPELTVSLTQALRGLKADVDLFRSLIPLIRELNPEISQIRGESNNVLPRLNEDIKTVARLRVPQPSSIERLFLSPIPTLPTHTPTSGFKWVLPSVEAVSRLESAGLIPKTDLHIPQAYDRSAFVEPALAAYRRLEEDWRGDEILKPGMREKWLAAIPSLLHLAVEFRSEIDPTGSTGFRILTLRSLLQTLPRLVPDIPENHWVFETLIALKKAGILVGSPDSISRGAPRAYTPPEIAQLCYVVLTRLGRISASMQDAARSLGSFHLSDSDPPETLVKDVQTLRQSWPTLIQFKRVLTRFASELKDLGEDPEAIVKFYDELLKATDKTIRAVYSAWQ